MSERPVVPGIWTLTVGPLGVVERSLCSVHGSITSHEGLIGLADQRLRPRSVLFLKQFLNGILFWSVRSGIAMRGHT